MEDDLVNATMDSPNSTDQEMNGAISPDMYFFSVFNAVGFLLNAFVIFVATRSNVIPGKIPLTFLVNQLTGDMLSCLVRSFVWATDRDWVLPDNVGSTVFCKLFYGGLIYWSIVSASFINLVLLNIERYVSVVHPTHHRKLTPRVIALLIFLSYALGVGENVTILSETIRVERHCQQIAAEEWTRFVATMQMILSFILPLIVIVFCNSRIIVILKQHSKAMRRHDAGSEVANPSALLQKRLQKDLSISVGIFGLVFFVTNAPISITYTLSVWGAIDVDYLSWYYEVIIFVMNCLFLVNPLVCLLQMRSLRSRAAKLLSCCPRNDRSLSIYSISGDPSAMALRSTTITGMTSTSRV